MHKKAVNSLALSDADNTIFKNAALAMRRHVAPLKQAHENAQKTPTTLR
jgi:hypothetical protein